MDLFGVKRLKKEKKELEERISELENEIKELESYKKRWEKEKKRYKKAVTEKQEAYEKINKLEDRISTLKDKSGKKSVEENFSNGFRKVEGFKIRKYLESLNKLEIKNATTVYNPAEKAFFDKKMSEVVLYEPFMVKSVLKTPVPLEHGKFRSDSFFLDSLMDKMDCRTLYIHFSIGGSGVGVFEDMELVESEIIVSDIKSKHKKGGYSQKRFERIRNEQIENHVEDVKEVVKGFMGKSFQQVVFSGKVGSFEKVLPEGFVKTTTGKGKVRDEGDLVDSFGSGMGIYIKSITEKDAKRLENVLD